MVRQPKKHIFEEINGEEFVQPDPAWDKKRKDKIYEIRLKSSGIPNDYWDLEFSDYDGKKSIVELNKAIKFAEHCKDEDWHNASLFIHGENSAQKTMIASAIGKEFLKNELDVKFVLAGNLINDLLQLQGFSRDEIIVEKIKKISNADLIIIDDAFDSRKSVYWKNNSDLIVAAWDSFLRSALSRDKRIIITSNYTVARIGTEFGISIYELIDRNFIQLEFKDNIKNVRKNRLDKLF